MFTWLRFVYVHIRLFAWPMTFLLMFVFLQYFSLIGSFKQLFFSFFPPSNSWLHHLLNFSLTFLPNRHSMEIPPPRGSTFSSPLRSCASVQTVNIQKLPFTGFLGSTHTFGDLGYSLESLPLCCQSRPLSNILCRGVWWDIKHKIILYLEIIQFAFG